MKSLYFHYVMGEHHRCKREINEEIQKLSAENAVAIGRLTNYMLGWKYSGADDFFRLN